MKPATVPPADFGRDHWSVLAYVEHLAVEKMPLAKRHLRAHPQLHPLFTHEGNSFGNPFPTRIAGGRQVEPHDDWCCLDELEADGLIQNVGTGVNRSYRMTEEGMRVSAALRAHKAGGGSTVNFVRPPREVAAP